MIFSILAKTYAFRLASSYPWAATLLGLAGLVADIRFFRRYHTEEKHSRRSAWVDVLLVNVVAVFVAVAAGELFDYLAMRWKTGCPWLADALAWMLRGLRLAVAAQGGNVHMTTMVGPLQFAVSLDNLGMTMPGVFAALGFMYLLLTSVTYRAALVRFVKLIGVLLLTALIQQVLSIVLFLFLSDFVGYDSEELPISPFVREATVTWLYLPLLLLAWPVLARWVGAAPSPAVSADTPRCRWLWLAWPALLVCLALALWQPQGQVKQGEVLVNTFHTRWSRTDRAYDREWYGADSGYNYACLKRWFELFYPVREVRERLRAEDLAHASVLIIYIPDQPFSPEEQRLIEEFVRGGGGLFLIGDHTNVFGSSSHLNDLCGRFGFVFRDDVLFDIDEDFFQLFDVPGCPSPFLQGMSFFKFRGPASIKPTSWSTRNVISLDHAKGRRAIYSVNNFYPPPHDDPKMLTGRFCVSAASRYGQGRVVGFADSTVFSNFEIFYPGKYEYLLNVVNWLNHSDGFLTTFARRGGLLGAWAMLMVLLAFARTPRGRVGVILGALLAYFVVCRGAARLETRRVDFPEPIGSADALFFVAEGDDPVYCLRAFTTDLGFEKRYDVFIQWVLRTGRFPGFLVGSELFDKGIFEHLQTAPSVRTGRALIVQDSKQLMLLKRMTSWDSAQDDHLLLMFSEKMQWHTIATSLQQTGLVSGEEQLAALRAAWPAGEVLLERNGRRLLVVFSAERFSDKSMGFSEKVVPSAAQRARFDEAFSLIDRLFEEEKEHHEN